MGMISITPAKVSTTYIATQNQTIFPFTYYVGYIEVFSNGVRLTDSEYVATDGLNVVLVAGAVQGDTIDLISYTMGQGVQGLQGTSVQGTQGLQGAQGLQGLAGLFAGQGAQGVAGYIQNVPAKTSVTYTATPGQTTFNFTF